MGEGCETAAAGVARGPAHVDFVLGGLSAEAFTTASGSGDGGERERSRLSAEAATTVNGSGHGGQRKRSRFSAEAVTAASGSGHSFQRKRSRRPAEAVTVFRGSGHGGVPNRSRLRVETVTAGTAIRRRPGGRGGTPPPPPPPLPSRTQALAATAAASRPGGRACSSPTGRVDRTAVLSSACVPERGGPPDRRPEIVRFRVLRGQERRRVRPRWPDAARLALALHMAFPSVVPIRRSHPAFPSVGDECTGAVPPSPLSAPHRSTRQPDGRVTNRAAPPESALPSSCSECAKRDERVAPSVCCRQPKQLLQPVAGNQSSGPCPP